MAFKSKKLDKKYIKIESYTNLIGQEVPAHKIAYTEHGKNNKEIIFCVHGLTRNSSDFHYLSQELSDKYRVIAVDMVGRGDSDYFDNPDLYNYVTYSFEVMKIIEKLDLNNINYIGTSMGGIIGFFICSKLPHLIKSFIVNDVGPELPTDSVKRIANYVGLGEVFNSFDECKDHVKKIYRGFGINDEEHWDMLTSNSFSLSEDGKYFFSYDPAIKFNLSKDVDDTKVKIVDLWEVWKAILSPTLILHGIESDILTKDIANKMIETNSNAKLVSFNCGHAPSLFYDDQIAVIRKWIDNI